MITIDEQPTQFQVATESAPEITEAQVMEAIRAEQGRQPQEIGQAVQTPQAPTVPVTDGQAPVQADQTVKTDVTSVETQRGVSYEQLQEKQGFKSVDDLATSYSNLVKKLHEVSQENSQLRQQPPQISQPQYQPAPTPQEDPNQKFLQDFSTNPLQTLAMAYQALNRPILENQQEAEFRSKLAMMSSSPKTADFNLPEIQSEIQKIIQERPQRYLNGYGKVDPSVMEDLYYMAKGRVGRPNVISNVPINGPVPVEGQNKPYPQQVQKEPKDMSEQELRNLIMTIASNR